MTLHKQTLMSCEIRVPRVPERMTVHVRHSHGLTNQATSSSQSDPLRYWLSALLHRLFLLCIFLGTLILLVLQSTKNSCFEALTYVALLSAYDYEHVPQSA